MRPKRSRQLTLRELGGVCASPNSYFVRATARECAPHVETLRRCVVALRCDGHRIAEDDASQKISRDDITRDAREALTQLASMNVKPDVMRASGAGVMVRVVSEGALGDDLARRARRLFDAWLKHVIADANDAFERLGR